MPASRSNLSRKSAIELGGPLSARRVKTGLLLLATPWFARREYREYLNHARSRKQGGGGERIAEMGGNRKKWGRGGQTHRRIAPVAGLHRTVCIEGRESSSGGTSASELVVGWSVFHLAGGPCYPKRLTGGMIS
jgi:hypothetical protein